MTSYAAPAGPPPGRTSAAVPEPEGNDADPFDPPPAYTPSAAQGSASGETTLAVGPAHMDFSGPPPMPDRLQQNITGVGVGYGARHQGALSPTLTGHSSQGGFGVPVGMNTHATGGSASGSGAGYRPPPPPQHPSQSGLGHEPSSSGKDTKGAPPASPSAAGPSRPPPPQAQDTSPTTVPTPGRPLLHRGQLLVYPKGHWCPKCGNTGYKANDPSNPHEADWRKYGKPYNSALATSYSHSSSTGANPSVSSASNFQRPLPSLPGSHLGPGAGPGQYGHLPPPPPPPPGSWHTYPGHHTHANPAPPPPPPPMHHGQSFGPGPGYGPHPGQQIFVQKTPGFAPPGALVVGPGDPRIGGRPCPRCYGSGRETDFFFGFDEGRCYACHGLGRVF
ncbi:hypothetical protein IAU60_004546 [Kwoniella sp. DSM 27419]